MRSVRIALLLAVAVFCCFAKPADASCPRTGWGGYCSDPTYESMASSACSQHEAEVSQCWHDYAANAECWNGSEWVPCGANNQQLYNNCVNSSHTSYTSSEEAAYEAFCFFW